MKGKGPLLQIIEQKRDDAIQFLSKLVSVDTSVVNQGERGHEGAAQPIVKERLEKLGCSIDVFEPDNEKLKSYEVDFNKGRHYEGRPNVVGVLKGTGGGRSIILSGHIDTVPYDESEWRFPPLSGKLSEGKMFGRGSIDMKSGLAAMILAVEAILEAGIKLRGDVIIASVVDEEGGGNGTLACVDKGYKADGAVITEGTGEKIIIANRGVLNVEVVVRGLAAHAAHKWTGVNAVEKMIKVINGLAELERKWLVSKHHDLLPSPTITVGQIEGGIGATVVPDSCTIKCDVKFLPNEIDSDMSANKVKKEFEDWVRLACSGDDWLRNNPASVRWYSEVMPYELPPDHSFPNFMRNAVREVNSEVALAGLAGGSDARILNNVGRIPTILFGPSGGNAHGSNEYVDLESYIRTIKSLALMTSSWCNETA